MGLVALIMICDDFYVLVIYCCWFPLLQCQPHEARDFDFLFSALPLIPSLVPGT